MARYIDANELQKKLEQVAKEPDYLHEGDTWDTGVYLAGVWVDKTPTADVVEVVRCEKCRFNVANMEKDGYDTTDYSGEDIVCSYFMTDGLEPTDYCSYGERRTDNDL